MSDFYYDERGVLRNGNVPPPNHPWRTGRDELSKHKKLRSAKIKAGQKRALADREAARQMYELDNASLDA